MADDLEAKKGVKHPSAARSRGPVLVVPILILAAAGFWFWSNRGGDSSARASGEPRIKSTLHLETFVLNLADPNQKSYLRVGIDLGLNQEAKHGEEVSAVALVRDTILGVLAEAKVDDLTTPAGKVQLKEKLLHALQERAPQLGVEEVYFTEFLIQR
jgi:flagellar basal body-associated protein FliL